MIGLLICVSSQSRRKIEAVVSQPDPVFIRPRFYYKTIKSFCARAVDAYSEALKKVGAFRNSKAEIG